MDPAFTGAYRGHVAYPYLVRRDNGKGALHQIWRWRLDLVAGPHDAESSFSASDDTFDFAQAVNAVLAAGNAALVEQFPSLERAWNPLLSFVQFANLCAQCQIFRAVAAWSALASSVVAAAIHAKDATHRRQMELPTVLLDTRVLHFFS